MKKAYWVLAVTGILLLIGIYYYFSPARYAFFPKCPFLWATGFRCPGCGSQRAIHELLNGEFGAAIRENVLVVIFIPYLILGIVTELIRQPSPQILRMRQRLFGGKAIWIVFTIVVVFAVMRNFPCCSHFL